MRPSNIAELFATHLTKVALKTQLVEGENKYETRVIKLGPEDPHFAFANMCCDVAIARAYGTTRLITEEMDQEEKELFPMAAPKSPYMQQLVQKVPQIVQVTSEIRDVCGTCVNYDKVDENRNAAVSDGKVIWSVTQIADATNRDHDVGLRNGCRNGTA